MSGYRNIVITIQGNPSLEIQHPLGLGDWLVRQAWSWAVENVYCFNFGLYSIETN